MGQHQSHLLTKHKTGSHVDYLEEDLYVPPEILVKVFSYLNVRCRGRAAQVCRAWRDIVYVPVLWRNDEVSRLSSATLFESYMFRGIRKVRSPAEPFDREKWARQVGAFSSYRSRHKATSEPVEISLDLLGERMNSRTDASLVNLLKLTSNSIRSLTVRYTKKISFKAIVIVVASECTNLVKLCIVNCMQRTSVDGNDFWKAMRNLRQLRCLVLKDLYGFDDDFFESLFTADQRKEIGSSGDCRITAALAPLPLTEFHLSLVYGVTNESIKYISQSLPKLIELNVLYCDQITYNGLAYLSACTNLRRLTLWCPRTIRHSRVWTKADLDEDSYRDLKEGLSTILRFLRQLDALVIVGCSYTSFEIMAKFSNVYSR